MHRVTVVDADAALAELAHQAYPILQELHAAGENMSYGDMGATGLLYAYDEATINAPDKKGWLARYLSEVGFGSIKYSNLKAIFDIGRKKRE